MTEEEAKTKMCFRAVTFAGSQQVADGPGPFCIGSACMAWRWGSLTSENRTEAIKRRRNETGCDLVSAMKWVDENPVVLRKGYCGLAGKP